MTVSARATALQMHCGGRGLPRGTAALPPAPPREAARCSRTTPRPPRACRDAGRWSCCRCCPSATTPAPPPVPSGPPLPLLPCPSPPSSRAVENPLQVERGSTRGHTRVRRLIGKKEHGLKKKMVGRFFFKKQNSKAKTKNKDKLKGENVRVVDAIQYDRCLWDLRPVRLSWPQLGNIAVAPESVAPL